MSINPLARLRPTVVLPSDTQASSGPDPRLECDTAPGHRPENFSHSLRRRAHLLFQQNITGRIQHAIVALLVAQIQTDGQLFALPVERLVCVLHAGTANLRLIQK